MTTLLFFHAHPDDEAIITGGTMARAVESGHRVVLVAATRGEHGEVADGFLDDDEALGARREKELHSAANVLGVSAVHFLDFIDSGMAGASTNELPGCFWQADVDVAAGRLAAICEDEGAELLTIYDENGGYGHPDHIQVHRVGMRAAQMIGLDEVYEATMCREEALKLFAAVGEHDVDAPGDMDDELAAHLGLPRAELTHAVDVTPWLEVKRAAMAAHRSQISETSIFLGLPDDLYVLGFGTEFYRRSGHPGGVPFADLPVFQ